MATKSGEDMPEERSPGIRARRIDAENVIHGSQLQGVPADLAQELLPALKPTVEGGITADHISARNVIEGIQILNSAGVVTVTDMRSQLAVLTAQLKELAANNCFNDPLEGKIALGAAADASAELDPASPDGPRVLGRLERLSHVLKSAVAVCTTAGTLSESLASVASLAEALYHAAQRLFGI
jgi:hypothetical protein